MRGEALRSEASQPRELIVGDVVRLRSGGMPMTVLTIGGTFAADLGTIGKVEVGLCGVDGVIRTWLSPYALKLVVDEAT